MNFLIEWTRFAYKMLRAMSRAADAAESLLAEKKRVEEKNEKRKRRRVSEVIRGDLRGRKDSIGEGSKGRRS